MNLEFAKFLRIFKSDKMSMERSRRITGRLTQTARHASNLAQRAVSIDRLRKVTLKFLEFSLGTVSMNHRYVPKNTYVPILE